MMRHCYIICIWVIVGLCLTSCRPEGAVVRADKANFNPDDQAKIGQALLSHIIANPTDYDLYQPSAHAEVYSQLNNELLRSVVNTQTVQNRNSFDWEIFIVRDNEQMTTFTLPGGKLFISSGFLKFLTNEAQLLALISHEINYSDSGVMMEILKDNYSGLLLGDLVYNNSVDEIDAMVKTLQVERISIDKVKAADEYAVDILCPFGYSATGIASMLETELGDEKYPLEWLDTRTDYDNRIDVIHRRASDCGDGSILGEARYRKLILNYLD